MREATLHDALQQRKTAFMNLGRSDVPAFECSASGLEPFAAPDAGAVGAEHRGNALGLTGQCYARSSHRPNARANAGYPL
jgi:hypothetical protein